MKKLFIVVALPCLAAMSACERGDRDLDRDITTDRSAYRVDTPNDNKIDSPRENMAPKYGSPSDTAAPKYGRGEGEKEIDRSGSAGILDNDGENKVADATVIATYRSMIAEDADLAAAAGNTRIVVENNDLVLRGTVATRDLSDSLEDLAKKIANDREIDNELEIDRE